MARPALYILPLVVEKKLLRILFWWMVLTFVLVDGIDRTESDPLRKLLVVDPSYGDSRTLYDAMVANYEYCGLTNVTPSTSHLNSNLKCVFD